MATALAIYNGEEVKKEEAPAAVEEEEVIVGPMI